MSSLKADEEQSLVLEDEPSPEDELMHNCSTVIAAGIWLIRNGYGKLQLLPYAAPSGCYWRCEFYPPGRPSKAFYRYSTSSAYRYLENHCGGRLSKSVKPSTLAKAIMVSVPDDVKAQCEGEVSRETEQWLAELERALAGMLVPEAFHDMTEDYSRWMLVNAFGGSGSMAPQPGYVRPGQEPHWSQSAFWRDALTRADQLVTLQEFPVSIADESLTDRVAGELAVAIKDADPFDQGRLLRAAVAALSKKPD